MTARFTITWDDKEGLSLPDGIVIDFVNKFLSRECGSLVVGSENIISAIRLAILKDVVKNTDVVFIIDGRLHHPTRVGNLKTWPPGFTDFTSNVSREIIRLQCIKAKQRD